MQIGDLIKVAFDSPSSNSNFVGTCVRIDHKGSGSFTIVSLDGKRYTYWSEELHYPNGIGVRFKTLNSC